MNVKAEILVKRAGAVCTLVINRPEKANALTVSCLSALADVIEEISGEDRVCVIVIRGAGDRFFSAGYDLSVLPVGPDPETAGSLKENPPLERAIAAIRAFPYPVIAMLNGDAFGGGCDLAVACDIRIGAADTKMGMPPARLGIVYPYPGYRRFLGVLGLPKALELFLTGRSYGGRECLSMGLVNHVVDRDKLEEFTYGLAAELAENAPLSLRGTKTVLYTLCDNPELPKEEAERLQALFVHSLQSEDVKEAQQAFLEKRKPRFSGR